MSSFPNLKKLLLVFILISIILILTHSIKQHESDIIEFSRLKKFKPNHLIKYSLSGKKTKYVNNHVERNVDNTLGSIKLVFEVDFNCSKCFIDLQEVYSFYINLSKIGKIEFCLVSKEKSLSYIEFFLEKSLKSYSNWVIQQEFRDKDTKLYLLDSENNIKISGNIVAYPFLKEHYKKEFIKLLKM